MDRTHKYSQKDGRVVTLDTGCGNLGCPNVHVTFRPSYATAGRKYELVCVSESASSILCGSSPESSTNEISESGLPPDEVQETTQNSLPPFCTISALMDTFGAAAERKRNITHSHNLMSLSEVALRLSPPPPPFPYIEEEAKTG